MTAELAPIDTWQAHAMGTGTCRTLDADAHVAQFIHAALHRLSPLDRIRRLEVIDAVIAASEAKRRALAGRL